MPNTRGWRLWPLVGLAIVFGGAGSVLVAVAVTRDHGQVSDIVQAAMSVLAPAGGLTLWLWTRLRRVTPTSADALARACDALAEAVRGQWERAAGERRLRHPAPIPLRWQWSNRSVTGPVAEALGRSGHVRHAPLPEMAAATLTMVNEGGLRDLFAVYGGLDSGRLIVMGDAGTGKSAAAILTVLDALSHRQGLDDVRRARVPVPVLLTVHGWDPHRQQLGEWLAAQLDAEYPFLRSDAFGQHAAIRMVESGRVALFLDGFDEIADALRPVAVRALDQQATFRLMVLTRTRELINAVADGHLQGAAALELLPVSADEAAAYLTRCQVQPPPSAWRRLAEHLRVMPDSALSTALDNPLMLTLVRDTFLTPADLDELLSPNRFTDRAEVEGYLLDRVLPSAYRHRPGQPPAPYSVEQATRWLGYLATQMNRRNTRDLAWWQIRQWSPVGVRILTIALPSSLGLGFALGGIFAPIFGLPTGIVVGLAAGPINGVAVALTAWLYEGHSATPSLSRRRRWNILLGKGSGVVGLAGGLASGLASGVAAGIVVGLERGFVPGLLLGAVVTLIFGLACGTTEGLLQARRNAGPRLLKQLDWSSVASRRNLGIGLAFGLIFSLVFGLTLGLTGGFAIGFVGGLVLGLVSALILGLISALAHTSAATASPMDPVTCWRRDLRSGLAEGCAFGLASSLAFGLVGGLVGGIETGLVIGPIAGFGEGLAFTLAASQAWLAKPAFLLLRRTDLFPRKGLRFLEDARKRSVLRTVGSVYQFRHARLQDQLATTDKQHRRFGELGSSHIHVPGQAANILNSAVKDA